MLLMQRHPPFPCELDRSGLVGVRQEWGWDPLRLAFLADCSTIRETNPGQMVTLHVGG